MRPRSDFTEMLREVSMITAVYGDTSPVWYVPGA
jgi:hypothetical protein